MIIKAQSQSGEFDRIVDHVGSMMDELLKDNFFRNTAPDAWQPALNVYEAGDCYVVCVDLAGMDREEIDVIAEEGTLYIRGDRPRPCPPDAPEEVSVQVMEIDSGRFQRKVSIPDDVNTDDIRASYRRGFLWLTLPRRGDGDQRD